MTIEMLNYTPEIAYTFPFLKYFRKTEIGITITNFREFTIGISPVIHSV